VDLEAGALEQGAVVFPAWIADVNLGLGQQLLQEVSTDFQRTGTAQGLHGQGAAFGNDGGVGTQQQGLSTQIVGIDPFNRQVAARGGFAHHGFLSLLNSLQNRDTPLIVVVNTDPQINFAAAFVG